MKWGRGREIRGLKKEWFVLLDRDFMS